MAIVENPRWLATRVDGLDGLDIVLNIDGIMPK